VNLASCTDLVIRLHTGPAGTVWFGADSLRYDTRLPPTRLLLNKRMLQELDSVQVIRVVGTPENAELLVRLFELKVVQKRLKGTQLLVYSPRIVSDLDDPEAVLDATWSVTDTGRLYGRAHAMRNSDYVSYVMLYTPHKDRAVVHYHPVWKPSTFVNSLEVTKLCSLIRDIIDPRWYLHESRCDRFGRLYRRLGLTEENMAAMVTGSRPGYRYEAACNAVHTWYNDKLDFGSDAPGDFLAEYVRNLPTEKALLKGTKAFVDLIVRVWLQTVQPYHPEVTFDALRFFRDETVSQAFKQHIEGL